MGLVADARRYYKDALEDLTGLLEQAGAGGDAVREDALRDANDRYSELLPRLVTLDVPTSPSGIYAVPADWVQGFSRLVTVEFPIGQNPPSLLREREYNLVETPTGERMYLSRNPTGTWRLSHTARHKYDPSDVSVPSATWPAEHAPLVGQWAAAISALFFAGRYAHSVESNNDGVNWRTKAQEWTTNAKSLEARIRAGLRHAEVSAWAKLSQSRASGGRRY